MKTKTRLVLILSLVAALRALSLAACGTAAKTAEAEESSLAAAAESTEVVAEETAADADNVQPTAEAEAEPAAETAAEASVLEADLLSAQETEPAAAAAPAETIVTTANVTSDGLIDASELFTDRDLTQTPDLSEAEVIAVADGEDVLITEEGVYVLQGTASGVTVYVETDQADDAKVQIVLDGVSITNEDFPCIYVKEADKVFVTTTATENNLSVTGTFVADGDTNTDGVIFCRSDLVLSGLGTLNISSTNNGVVCKDDLKIVDSVLVVSASSIGIKAGDSVRIGGGSLEVNALHDGIRVENKDGTSFFYMEDGSFVITAGYDGIDVGTSDADFTGSIKLLGGSGEIYAGGGAENAKGETSQKGIKCDGDIIAAGIDMTVSSPDDAVHGNGSVTVGGGALRLLSSDDAITAKGTLTITDGTIDVQKSYEALEGSDVNISGGEITLVSSDDGINAGGGSDTSASDDDTFSSSSGDITISGGSLYIDSSGDGIDSNGDVNLIGGRSDRSFGDGK